MKLKTAALLGLIVFSGCGESHTPSGYISKNISLYDPGAVAAALDQMEIPKDNLMQNLESLHQRFKNSYMGYDLKNGEQVFADCKTKAESAPEKLKTFEIYDYVLKCLSGFHDTHLYFKRLNKPVTISSPISLSVLVEGKLILAGIRPGLIKKIEELQNMAPDTLKNILTQGSEITALNGETPEKEIDRLKQFVSASSAAFQVNEAVSNLFYRSWAYPSQKDFSITIKSKEGVSNTVTLPWVQIVTKTNIGGSIDSRMNLSKKGIPMGIDLVEEEMLRSKGTLDFTPPLFGELSGKRVFSDKDDEPMVVTGIAHVNGKAFCYFQLNTFEFDDQDKKYAYKMFEMIDGSAEPVSFEVTLTNFLSSCQGFGAPLIIDVRNNGGGDAGLPTLIQAHLEAAGAPAVYDARSIKLDSGNFAFLMRNLDQLDQPQSELRNILYFDAIQNGQRAKRNTSDWILMRDPKLTTGTFTGSAFVLTSESCISACDIFVRKFKVSGRGKIFGTSTNGTGMGFSSRGGSQNQFVDTLNLYTIDIPNFAFNIVKVQDDSKFKIDDQVKGSVLEFAALKLMENNPTVPDFVIEYKLKDLTNNFESYGKTLAEQLAPAP